MNWPHAPTHWLFEPGLYMVRAGTHQKLPHLNTPERLDFFLESLFTHAAEFGWELRAWAVLANHYHFVAASPPDPGNFAEIPRQTSHADRQANQPVGQLAGTESVVSVLGQPDYV
jgi:putative transposase